MVEINIVHWLFTIKINYYVKVNSKEDSKYEKLAGSTRTFVGQRKKEGDGKLLLSKGYNDLL